MLGRAFGGRVGAFLVSRTTPLCVKGLFKGVSIHYHMDLCSFEMSEWHFQRHDDIVQLLLLI